MGEREEGGIEKVRLSTANAQGPTPSQTPVSILPGQRILGPGVGSGNLGSRRSLLELCVVRATEISWKNWDTGKNWETGWNLEC